VALAWLLHLSPNILLIPGTSSVAGAVAVLTALEMDAVSTHYIENTDLCFERCKLHKASFQ